MKEDVLEQIGTDWLQQKQGVFVKSNLKYRPSKNNINFIFDQQTDSIHSDIDLLAIDTSNLEVVTIVNCKAWMDGFDVKDFNDHLSTFDGQEKKFGGKEYWKHFRDLINPKWHYGFIERIKDENPKTKKIKYIILCAHARNANCINEWTNNMIIQDNFNTTGIELLSIEVKEIKDLIKDINTTSSDYAENSEFCRILQLFRSCKIL